MATNFWKCEICQYIGPTQEFLKDELCECPSPTGHELPTQDREQVFPHRLYQCDLCGFEGDHDHFFGRESSIDDDPIELRWQAICGELAEDMGLSGDPEEDEFDMAASPGCHKKVTVTQIK